MSNNKSYEAFDRLYDQFYASNAEATRNSIQSLLWTGEVSVVPWLKERNIDEDNIEVNDVIDFFEDLQSAYSPTSQHGKANQTAYVYGKMIERGWIDCNKNPFVIALEDHDILDQIVNKEVKIYSRETIREVLMSLHPIMFVASMIMLKTSRRIGGTVNLDLRDVHLSHPGVNWEVVEGLKDKPDHIHFAPNASRGEEWRGEVRRDSAKTNTTTYIPVDDELKDCLIFLLSFRRASNISGPLLTNIGTVEPGVRLTSRTYSTRILGSAKELGYWVEPHHPNNIRSHYWRHWTTTHMKDRIKSSTVDYFRGDKKETSDHYNHWSEKKAREWLDNIPKVFERYQRY